MEPSQESPAPSSNPEGPLPPAPPTGHRRNFSTVLLLGIVTLGFYFVYWQWRVFREVRSNHREQLDTRLFWASIAFSFLSAIVSVAGGFARIVAGGAAGWNSVQVTAALGLASLGLLYAYMRRETLNLDARLTSVRAAPTQALRWLTAGLAVAAVMNVWRATGASLPWIAFALANIPLSLAAYGALQVGLNRYWSSVAPESTAEAPTGLTPVPP